MLSPAEVEYIKIVQHGFERGRQVPAGILQKSLNLLRREQIAVSKAFLQNAAGEGLDVSGIPVL